MHLIIGNILCLRTASCIVVTVSMYVDCITSERIDVSADHFWQVGMNTHATLPKIAFF